MSYNEPIHDNTVRTTATSESEGRIKDMLKSRKRKSIKKRLNNYK